MYGVEFCGDNTGDSQASNDYSDCQEDNKYSNESRTEQSKLIIEDLQHYISECSNVECDICHEVDLLLEFIDQFDPERDN